VTDTAGIYVAFEATPGRVEKGCRITTCNRCGKLAGHWPQQSAGHEIICLGCADQIPAIRQHIDQLARERE
jgi:hypothetical protein